MFTPAQAFYSQSALRSCTRRDVLEGRVVRINPALITITDGLVATTPPAVLQQRVEERVRELLPHGVRTFHVDVNCEDYRGYGSQRPDINTAVFTPAFLRSLNDLVRASGGFLNLHLLTDSPPRQLRRFETVGMGAVCFQLEVVRDPAQLEDLIRQILAAGACASPVVETVGTESLVPPSPAEVRDRLAPVLDRVGMLTLQATGTAGRSSGPGGAFQPQRVQSYLDRLRPFFTGTIQIQGGITTGTVGPAVALGAEFLVCGTQIFRHQEGLTPPEVVDSLLVEAAAALQPRSSR